MKKATTASELLAIVRKKLEHVPDNLREKTWLDLKNPHLNAVLGDPKKGLFWGQIIEVAGKQSNGKSALAYDLAATAQATGALVHWVDFENSFSEEWASKRGLKPAEVALLQPYVGRFGKAREKRLCTAQELLSEQEAILRAAYDRDKTIRQFIVVDSVAAMLVEEEGEAGLSGQNMRTNVALPFFLGKLLRRWISFLREVNAIALFINQLRTKPGMAFGDPDYSPGGNALPFYAHSRVRMRRVKSGRVLERGKMAGVKGVLVNHKNKAGGIEGWEIGFKIMFNGVSKFVTAADVREEEDVRK